MRRFGLEEWDRQTDGLQHWLMLPVDGGRGQTKPTNRRTTAETVPFPIVTDVTYRHAHSVGAALVQVSHTTQHDEF